MSAAPKQFLDLALLRQLAGEQLFASGEQCFALGRVRQVRAAKERVSARVTGDLTYQVKLWRRSGKLCFLCDCEAGQAETFCKHCVAVGLAWLSRSNDVGSPTPKEATRTTGETKKQAQAHREEERRSLTAHLKTLDADRLAKLLLEATDYDEILRRRLLLETIGVVQEKTLRGRGGQPSTSPDLAAYRQLLQEAIRPNGYVDFHAMPDFVQGIEEAIAPLQEMLRAGWNDAVIALTEFALVELDDASDRVDTGDGLLNRVYDNFQHYHLEACRAGMPPPAALAARLLHYELEGGLGIFNNAVRTYADILGPVGTSAWRSLLIREWQQVVGRHDVIGRSEADGPVSLDHRRFQLQALTERLARDAGDVDALLALKRADLHGVHDHIALAEELAGNGRHEEAIRCAEDASFLFPAAPEKSVWRDFLIAAYQRVGRHGAALGFSWDQFCETGEVEQWRELRTLVRVHDAKAWPEWREKALEFVRQQAETERERVGRVPGSARPDGSRRVEFLIEEELYDSAWQAALESGCRDDLWLRLAGQRENGHPQDVLPIYQRQIDRLLETSTRGGHREVIALIARIRTLYRRLHRRGDYERYRLALRSIHRQKRGFLRLLDEPEN